MVEIIDTEIPQELNNRMIHCIMRFGLWQFGRDELSGDPINLNTTDAGMLSTTYATRKNNPVLDLYTPENCYALVVHDIITSKLNQKFRSLNRIMWNVYFRSVSKPTFHVDQDSHNFYTFVYNLHDNDGGTEIKINNETKFYSSKAGQAIVFPSHLEHRGVEPKTQDRRFSIGYMVSI